MAGAEAIVAPIYTKARPVGGMAGRAKAVAIAVRRAMDARGRPGTA
jgi:hypothetical protein